MRLDAAPPNVVSSPPPPPPFPVVLPDCSTLAGETNGPSMAMMVGRGTPADAPNAFANFEILCEARDVERAARFAKPACEQHDPVACEAMRRIASAPAAP